MFLIMSGAYVTEDLKAEFGTIPPAFLPLGNRRQFQHQIQKIPKGKGIYLSLPDSYKIPEEDNTWLAAHNINIIRTPVNLSIGEAIVTSLNIAEEMSSNSLSILFGDTLLESYPTECDIIATANTLDNYTWSTFSTKNEISRKENKQIICGYFNFTHPKKLIKCITIERWDFINGVNRYNNENGLSNFKVKKWYDFGHINTYYHSKTAFTTQRAFNDLKINQTQITKSSKNNNKILAEANWFESIPPMLRVYTPQYLGCTEDKLGNYSYSLEYLHNISLNELFVFTEIPTSIWDNIFTHCIKFIDYCKEVKNIKNEKFFNELLTVKTKDRLNDYLLSEKIKIDEKWTFNKNIKCSILDILDLSKQYLPAESKHATLMHGDFCFSNILYDFRADKIKVIDPRGITHQGQISIYGDILYDIAKLSHSVLGMYDWIIAGYHQTSVDYAKRELSIILPNDNKIDKIKSSFLNKVCKHYNLTPLNIYAMQIQLFISMLTLHSDDKYRQSGLFANAFRIYSIMKELIK